MATVSYGYLGRPNLATSYLAGAVDEILGMQAQFVVEKQATAGMQAEFFLLKDNPEAQQALLEIKEVLEAQGFQITFTPAVEKAIGMQALLNLAGVDTPTGMQADLVIKAFHYKGMEFKADTLAHITHPKYLTYPYLTDPYLSDLICAFMGMQAQLGVVVNKEVGSQVEFVVEKEDATGNQVEFVIEVQKPIGFQVDAQKLASYAMQALATLYNTTNLRILCEFLSRGNPEAVGNNAWGNPAGTGANWVASSTAPGDFAETNLNTDIVEQVWRSNTVVAGLTLDCDTERTQGVFLDTFAILNHNITTSANVFLYGSNSPTFATIGTTIPLQVTDENVYYIAPSLPNTGFRYWRISIDDPTNPDGYLEIGTIVFGASTIFQGECFVDELDFQLKDFADTVETEGFTNVSNSRAQKRVLRLDFRSLSAEKANFKKLRSMFQTHRTVLKCLWIPTPDPVDPEVLGRYTVFSKLADIPNEKHNSKGPSATFVSFTIELDESK